ncbi:MAG TPA: hypothetical protein VIY49_31435 [Bryobacteraceae bacterium]
MDHPEGARFRRTGRAEIHEEIHREHRLLSNRMSWYLMSQAFLVGAFAVAGDNNYRLWWMSYFIPVIGIVITAWILCSIIGGLLAMAHLRGKHSYNRDCYGASRGYHWLGISPLWAIPGSLLLAWIAAFWLLAVYRQR